MTLVEDMAEFVTAATYAQLPEPTCTALKIRVLDAVGCAIGALKAAPIAALSAHVQDFGGAPHCALIGGGRAAPDRAAFYNGALVRYLDFNDSYLAPGETCHPSDNLGAVLAASEYADRDGRTLLTALAVAYQVQCRLSDVAPVRQRGFDHTTQGVYAAAAGVARALELDRERTAHALAIAGTAFNALRVTRTGALSNWKGLAAPNAAFGATHAAFLAARGITGPLEVFEGNKGFMETISGRFALAWASEDLQRVNATILKKYNAEIHSQTAIEGLLALQAQHGFEQDDIERIDVDIFDVAFNIIGGGEEGSKTVVHSKEEADHSLPYILAVALIDGQVMPAQYSAERIGREDAQQLLQRIFVRPNDEYSRRFPDEMACRITVRLRDGRRFETEQTDYPGFKTSPMSWEDVRDKFDGLTDGRIEPRLRDDIAEAIASLDEMPARELGRLLERAGERA